MLLKEHCLDQTICRILNFKEIVNEHLKANEEILIGK
jgi:hypothetical protein